MENYFNHTERTSHTGVNQFSSRLLPEQTFLPEAYHLPESSERGPLENIAPSVVFIEVTNHCNLRCQTCPRTFLDREKLKSLSLDEFISIADQFPNMQRALLHGIGEPLLNQELPEMIRCLKKRGVEVIINSNGTLLTADQQEDLLLSGLDEYRCSIDGARDETYAKIRGANLLSKVLMGLEGLVNTKIQLGVDHPRISIWCVVTRDNLEELPELVRIAARVGVEEVYVQRMVFFAREPQLQYGMAGEEHAIFNHKNDRQEAILHECTQLSAKLGIDFRASGARDPINSLAAARSDDFAPWQQCLRPWTTAYVTVNGNCLPCCISPFATHNYRSLILGNLFDRPFAEIWNDTRYKDFRSKLLSESPHEACSSCGVYWSI